MSYQDHSEFERLKHADVSQGKRVAALLARVAELEQGLREACELTVSVAADSWRDDPVFGRIAKLRALADDVPPR